MKRHSFQVFSPLASFAIVTSLPLALTMWRCVNRLCQIKLTYTKSRDSFILFLVGILLLMFYTADPSKQVRKDYFAIMCIFLFLLALLVIYIYSCTLYICLWIKTLGVWLWELLTRVWQLALSCYKRLSSSS